MVWAVEHFQIFLFGMDSFELITDHKPLEAIFSPKSKPCARIERWVLRLQSFKYKVVYRPGKSNIADSLSRLCSTKPPQTAELEDSIYHVVEYSVPVAVSFQDINNYSKLDPEIASVRNGLYEGTWEETVKSYKIFQSELCFYKNTLLRGNRIVIPKQLRPTILRAAHEGHPGIVSMKKRLRTKVWWPGIDLEAEKMVRQCKGCTLVSAPNPPNPLKRRELPSKSWIDVAVDYMGPLPSNEYIFVIIDYYSRYKEIKVMRSTTSSSTIDVLREIFSRLGLPESITADNGRQFCSAEFKTFCKENNIILYHTIPYWPQQNGEVERQNRSILKRIKISQSTGRNWKHDLMDYLTMYNSTPHCTTGKTPFELFFSRQFRDKLPSIPNISPIPIDEEVEDRDKHEKAKGKEYADRKRRATESSLDCGDKVYVKNINKENKLTPNFKPDAHTVIEKKGGDITVKNDDTGEEYRKNIVHLKKIGDQWTVCNKDKE